MSHGRLSGASCADRPREISLPTFSFSCNPIAIASLACGVNSHQTHFSPSAKMEPDQLTCCFGPDLCLFHSYVVFLGLVSLTSGEASVTRTDSSRSWWKLIPSQNSPWALRELALVLQMYQGIRPSSFLIHYYHMNMKILQVCLDDQRNLTERMILASCSCCSKFHKLGGLRQYTSFFS